MRARRDSEVCRCAARATVYNHLSFAVLPRVVALPVDRRHSPAHLAEIRGELSPMMNRVAQPRLQVRVRREVEDPAEVDGLQQLLAVERLDFAECPVELAR